MIFAILKRHAETGEAITGQGVIEILPDGFGNVVFWEVLVFLATVVVAYVYAWRRGVFRWR